MAIDREVVAYHEAGHAVAAHEFDMQVDRISIQAEGDDAGHVEHDYGCDMSDAFAKGGCEKQIAIEQAVIVALAGEAAQRRFRPDSVLEEHTEGDDEQVHRLLSRLVGDDDQEARDAWQRLLAIRADRLIAAEWGRVVWLATALMKHKTLDSAEEIRHIILDFDLPPEHRGQRLSPTERLAVLLGHRAGT